MKTSTKLTCLYLVIIFAITNTSLLFLFNIMAMFGDGIVTVNFNQINEMYIEGIMLFLQIILSILVFYWVNKEKKIFRD